MHIYNNLKIIQTPCTNLWRQTRFGSTTIDINPLKPSVIMWLHFECSAPCRPNLPFLISDIRALWRSGLSARMPECQKLKTVG